MNLLDIFITTTSFAGGFVVMWEVWKHWQDRERLTWRVTEAAMNDVLTQMNRHNYRPDLIIGVGRGGAIVGGMLAGNLGHVPMCVIDTELDKTGGMSTATVRFPDCLPSIAGQEVLVVVGELYSGEDLRAGVNFIAGHGPAGLTTMSLFSHPASVVQPNYLGKETKKPLDAPWRIADVYRNRRL